VKILTINVPFIPEDAVAEYRSIDAIESLGLPPQHNETRGERIVEFAGRTCYQSYNRPNPNTKDIKDYLANIIAQGHESVLEHAFFSFYVEGVSRNLLLELERHRHLSFSVISQRFVNSADTPMITPPALREGEAWEWDHAVAATRDAYQAVVKALTEQGLTRKEVREAARAILPGGVETKFVVSGNVRAWRDVLKKRYSVHADAEIRELASLVLGELRWYVPNMMQDFPEEPFK